MAADTGCTDVVGVHGDCTDVYVCTMVDLGKSECLAGPDCT